jgi:hypothetical protein
MCSATATAVYEQDTFMMFSNTLAAFEQTCIQQLGVHKPWDLGNNDTKEPALLHKEITPNGCQALVEQHPCAEVFVDLGSGVGQAALVVSMISGMICFGVELQPGLHEMALDWCTDSAATLPPFRNALLKQATRFLCADMLGEEGAMDCWFHACADDILLTIAIRMQSIVPCIALLHYTLMYYTPVGIFANWLQ